MLNLVIVIVFWMFYSCSLNHRMNRLHERSLRMTYNDYTPTFEDLLIKDNTVTNHKRSLRVLVIELYKISHNLAPTFTRDMMMINLKVNNCARSTREVTTMKTVSLNSLTREIFAFQMVIYGLKFNSFPRAKDMKGNIRWLEKNSHSILSKRR